jgi:nitrate/nitrite-specific signal transduction histidine kinase
VIGEAIANAAKHSRSPNVLISAEEEGFGLLRLSIASEGRLSETQPSGGYGSQILGEVTRSWSLTERDGKVTLTARLPLNS